MDVLNIILEISLFLVFFVIVNKVIYDNIIFKNYYFKLIEKMEGTGLYKKLDMQLIKELKRIKPRIDIAPKFLLMICIVIGLSVFVLVRITLGIMSTALITAIVFFTLPFVLIDMYIKVEKKKVKHQLPGYIINIRNHIENDNNIILALQDTEVQEPLKKHIDKFSLITKRGINIKQGFASLKSDVNIKIFSSFINAVSTCYSNGGNFEEVLNRFSRIITKENFERERLKENSYYSIITLLTMICINIYVMVAFIFGNKEYHNLIKNTMVGNVILNLSIITYVLIAYLIIKIYGMEE